jgi:hypothetical protein
MFISHGVWLLRTRDLRRRAKDADLPFDELPEARAWQEGGFKLGPMPNLSTLLNAVRRKEPKPEQADDGPTTGFERQQDESCKV